MDFNIEEIQKRLKELLWEFHNICEENGLIYNLYGGTFLGAVRHQDIIPWDDDIDVSMPRRDYEKFIKIVREKYPDKFKMYAYPQKNYIYSFGKFCDRKIAITEELLRKDYGQLHLFIDIFPMDGYPEGADEEKQHFDLLRKLKKGRCHAVYKIIPSKVWWKKVYALVRLFESLPARVRGVDYYLAQEIKESLKYSFEDCRYVSCAVSWHEKGKVLKEDYLDRTLYQFGEHSYWGMRDYDKYLSQLYGNYMKLPDEKDRVSEHTYTLHESEEEI